MRAPVPANSRTAALFNPPRVVRAVTANQNLVASATTPIDFGTEERAAVGVTYANPNFTFEQTGWYHVDIGAMVQLLSDVGDVQNFTLELYRQGGIYRIMDMQHLAPGGAAWALGTNARFQITYSGLVVLLVANSTLRVNVRAPASAGTVPQVVGNNLAASTWFAAHRVADL